MKTKVVSLMTLIALSITACSGTAAPSTSPTQSPIPTSTPIVSPITSPVETPAAPRPGSLITKPESAKWNNAPQAALNARKMLVDQLKVDIDTIGLVSVEQVDWPDACMGIKQEGVMCAQIIVPGYKVVLSAGGQEYEFHTDEIGDVVRLVK